MKVIAYGIRQREKEPLAVANRRKHHITLVTNPLSLDTVDFAEGKDAVIISPRSVLVEEVMSRLIELGVRYILTTSEQPDHSVVETAVINNRPIHFNHVSLDPRHKLKEGALEEALAAKTISILDTWEENKQKSGSADQNGYSVEYLQITQCA